MSRVGTRKVSENCREWIPPGLVVGPNWPPESAPCSHLDNTGGGWKVGPAPISKSQNQFIHFWFHRKRQKVKSWTILLYFLQYGNTYFDIHACNFWTHQFLMFLFYRCKYLGGASWEKDESGPSGVWMHSREVDPFQRVHKSCVFSGDQYQWTGQIKESTGMWIHSRF